MWMQIRAIFFIESGCRLVASGDVAKEMWADLGTCEMQRAEQPITLNFIKNPRRASKESITVINPGENKVMIMFSALAAQGHLAPPPPLKMTLFKKYMYIQSV